MNNRREHKRLEKEYRLEYGPFSSLIDQDSLRTSILKNLSGGGISFCSEDAPPVGSQLFIKIFVQGWKQGDGKIEKTSDDKSEAVLKIIAEVLHVDSDEEHDCFWIGAKFLGQVKT